jgi:hypothetical protein
VVDTAAQELARQGLAAMEEAVEVRAVPRPQAVELDHKDLTEAHLVEAIRHTAAAVVAAILPLAHLVTREQATAVRELRILERHTVVAVVAAFMQELAVRLEQAAREVEAVAAPADHRRLPVLLVQRIVAAAVVAAELVVPEPEVRGVTEEAES